MGLLMDTAAVLHLDCVMGNTFDPHALLSQPLMANLST